MTTFFLVFGIMLLVVIGMSVGVIFQQKKLNGSCGGVGNIPGLKSDCKCDNPCDKKAKAEAEAKTEHKVNFPA